jgi:hypothetical protein
MTSSSIGAAWPPQSTSHERIRGFYNEGIIDSSNNAKEFADQVDQFRADFDNQQERTRLSVRFIAEAAQLKLLDGMGVQIEAAIPLAGKEASGLVLAYTGYNKPERQVSHDQRLAHEQLLDKVISSPRPHHDAIVGNTIDKSTPDSRRSALVPYFLELYAQFGYDEQDVDELLGNTNNTIMFVEQDGRVVSTAMAERASVPIKGFGTLELAEITEAATHPKYRQKGLYTAVSGLLIEKLVTHQASEPLHAIYGESSLAMPGVLYAAHQNGRRFSYQDENTYSLSSTAFGVLPQNFHIQDGREQRPYNDFAVSYVPLNNGAHNV